jgi:hypothetical protein
VSGHSAKTLTDDIRALARMLLDHPEAGPIIRDAGVRRDFTEEEEAFVGELARNSPMMELFRPYKTQWGWSARGALDSPNVGIGLARQIADGLIESVDAPQATDLIERNKVLPPEPGTSDSPDFHKRQVPFPIFYKVLLEFLQTPDLKQGLHDYKFFDVAEEGYHNHARLRDKLRGPAQRHLFRYGEIALPDFLDVCAAHFGGHIDVHDVQSLKAFLEKSSHNSGVNTRGIL